ncbi:unnamed protein product [Rotaria sp. Silwood1]|nr:unnamed protein product [Rotaria sp. Silwood1]CAF0865943.1 unnamed protein product [Rotaria sp. Silwood1]CAF0881422.1 unnamed protein product [Rotaria sp. Silwood1]CAF3366053.1 unnamed protein product [Rotaria sp. Silwood1]
MLAMKDLIRNYMITKEEAAENIRNGIKNNITTHVVWHVYDLWQRYKCKCDEVIKAIQCEKIGKDSLTILHDLSLLQIQMCDLEGTRHQLFNLKLSQRQS